MGGSAFRKQTTILSLPWVRERCSGLLLQWLAHKAQRPFFLRPVPSFTYPANRNNLSRILRVYGFLSSLSSITVITFGVKVVFYHEENASPQPQDWIDKITLQLASGNVCPKQMGWPWLSWLRRHYFPGKGRVLGFLFCASDSVTACAAQMDLEQDAGKDSEAQAGRSLPTRWVSPPPPSRKNQRTYASRSVVPTQRTQSNNPTWPLSF